MSTEPTCWRLIRTPPGDGVCNMALDEALLSSFDPATSLPILRLYGWEPPALSLGRFQDARASVELERCRAAGLTVVRRVTGGGAIFHADELTYALVCAPRHLPPGLSVKGSFRHLTTFLLRFYEGLGLAARYASDEFPTERLGERTPYCFAGRESYDILIDGRKIGGNAQRRLRETIFQHGSIPLKQRVAEGLAFMTERPAGVVTETLALEPAGIHLNRTELEERLAAAFGEAMGVTLRDDRLSVAEERAADRFLAKYRHEDWTVDGVIPP